MYLPKAFDEDRLPVLHDAIRAAGLATLVTATAAGPEASHVPMLLDPAAGERGTLYAHVARANGQWRDTIAGTRALAIFNGPDAYVSPSWYATKPETGKVVPTWNYIVVHAYGEAEFFDDPERLRALVARLTDRQESRRPAPWSITDAPADYIAGQLRAIVGVALPIARLEGKWKLSQNRPEADQAGVVAGLGEATDDRTLALRDAMRARRARSGS